MALTVSPTYPLPGEVVTVSQTRSSAGFTVDVIDPEVTLTSVPPDSVLETGRVEDDSGPVAEFTPDVSGDYGISVLSYRESFAAAQFDGGGEAYRIGVATETATVRVGEAMTIDMRAGEHAATLTLGVFNGTVRTATLTDTTSQKAYAASHDSTVVTKLAALVDQAATGLGPDLIAKVADLGVQFNDHRTQGGVHPVSDTTNVYQPDRTYDLTNAIVALNAIRAKFVAHLIGASISGSRWHNADDTKSLPIVGNASDVATAIVLYADMFRCFEAHRVLLASPAAHSLADSTNTLGTIDKLSDLIGTWLAFIASSSPTVPTGLEDGVIQLQSLYGFKKAS